MSQPPYKAPVKYTIGCVALLVAVACAVMYWYLFVR